MKKFILPVFIFLALLLLLAPRTSAQEGTDCRKIFDQDMKKCSTDFNSCQAACSKKTEKPDGTLYFNSGEIYRECVKESDCSGKSSACNEQSLANYRACLKSGKEPTALEAKKETPKQDGIRALVGTHEIYDAARGIYVNLDSFYGIYYGISIEEITEGKPSKGLVDLLNRTPLITKEDEEKAWEVFLPIYIPSEENITVVKGQGQLKMPTSSDFVPITSTSGGDTLQVTYLDSIVRSTSDTVQLGHSWAPDSGAVINIPQGTELKFLKPVQDEKTQELKRMLKLNKGEVEIKVKNANQKDKFGVQGDFFDLFVIQTHFWVSQSQDKKLAVIGVYEGEVEVKTKDGKVVKVKPDGDKPGVVVVSRRLSPVKLGLVGLALAVVTVGAILILSRKFTLKGFSKKIK